jgi:hypothetical protein
MIATFELSSRVTRRRSCLSGQTTLSLGSNPSGRVAARPGRVRRRLFRPEPFHTRVSSADGATPTEYRWLMAQRGLPGT